MKMFKRSILFGLCIAIILTCLPLNVFAAGPSIQVSFPSNVTSYMYDNVKTVGNEDATYIVRDNNRNVTFNASVSTSDSATKVSVTLTNYNAVNMPYSSGSNPRNYKITLTNIANGYYTMTITASNSSGTSSISKRIYVSQTTYSDYVKNMGSSNWTMIGPAYSSGSNSYNCLSYALANAGKSWSSTSTSNSLFCWPWKNSSGTYNPSLSECNSTMQSKYNCVPTSNISEAKIIAYADSSGKIIHFSYVFRDTYGFYTTWHKINEVLEAVECKNNIDPFSSIYLGKAVQYYK